MNINNNFVLQEDTSANIGRKKENLYEVLRVNCKNSNNFTYIVCLFPPSYEKWLTEFLKDILSKRKLAEFFKFIFDQTFNRLYYINMWTCLQFLIQRIRNKAHSGTMWKTYLWYFSTFLDEIKRFSRQIFSLGILEYLERWSMTGITWKGKKVKRKGSLENNYWHVRNSS